MNDLIAKASMTPAAIFDDKQGCLLIRASSPVPDRDDEVVVPEYLILDSYKTNPVVLAFHDQLRMPIAKCENPSGVFRCWVDAGDLWQEWWFDKSAEGEAFAGLYQRKTMRGASIGFKSFGLELMRPEESEAKFGVRKRLAIHKGGELFETSAVPVPSCPAALSAEWIDTEGLASAISRGYIGSTKIPEMVLKSLTPFADKLTTWRTSVSEFPKNFLPSGNVDMETAKSGAEAMADKNAGDVAAPEVKVEAKTVEPTKVEPAKPAPEVVAEVKAPKAPETPTVKDASTDQPADDNSDTTSDQDESGVGSHEQVKAGLEAAMHECMASFHKGEMEWEQCKEIMDSYAADHSKYSGKGEDEGEEEGDEGDGEDDSELDDSEKGLSDSALILKRLDVIVAKLNEHDEALELTADLLAGK